MKYLIFDAETTGIPEDMDAPSTDTDNWARVVQLAWTLVSDKAGAVGDVHSFIVRPQGFRIPAEAARIHGITTTRAKREGHSVKKVLGAFLAALQDADGLVAHNTSFDAPTVGAEFVRAQGTDPLEAMPQTCTMEETMELCGLPKPWGGYKWPTLQELHWELFGHGFESAHDAGADVAACASCFSELVRRQIITPTTPPTPSTPASTVDPNLREPEW